MEILLLMVYIIGVFAAYCSLTVTYDGSPYSAKAVLMRIVLSLAWCITYPVLFIFGRKD
jgi:hypothetical protein